MKRLSRRFVVVGNNSTDGTADHNFPRTAGHSKGAGYKIITTLLRYR